MKKVYFKKNILTSLLICLTIFLLQKNCSFAEQTIINIPSSEVVPLGQMILKQSTKISPTTDDLSTVLAPVFTFGTGKGLEFSTGVGTTIQDNTFVRANLATKKVFFIGSGSRITIGGSVNPYLTETATPDTLFYTHFSQRIKKTRTSLTAGVYTQGQKHMPNRAGVLFGIEQVIIPNKLRVAMDWISGEHSYGKFGVGLKYRPIPSVSITSAVIVPNKDDDNIAFSLSVSKFLSIPDEESIKEMFKWKDKKSL